MENAAAQLDLGVTDAAWRGQLETMRAQFEAMVRVGDVRRLQLFDRIIEHIHLKPEAYADRHRTRVRMAFTITVKIQELMGQGDYMGAAMELAGLRLTLESIGRSIPHCLPK